MKINTAMKNLKIISKINLKKVLNPFIILIFISLTSIILSSCTSSVKSTALKDREGNDFLVPQNITKIISLSPSITQVIIDLGLEDKLVAVDKYSKPFLSENNNIPEFDIMNPDAEQLANIQADIIFAAGMSRAQGADPLKLVRDMGAVVTYIPVSKTIAEIQDDITFISIVTNKEKEGKIIVDKMLEEIKKYTDIGEKIANKKTIYFEISAAPNLYSFGKDVFLNEMIEIIGAKNIFGNETGWLSVSEESVVSYNPDYILTNVDYIENPVEEIKARSGFREVNAVKNNTVYYIDKNSSSFSNHNIVKAIKEIAETIYPEEYKK